MHNYPSFGEVTFTATPPSALHIKMFIHNDPHEAESAISEWLQENPVSVQYITQSQSEKGGHFVFVVSVFYQKSALRF
jgi:hypothetical protein